MSREADQAAVLQEGGSELDLCYKSLCFAKLGRWAEARKDATLAVDREPASGKAHFHLAFALFRAGTASDQADVSEAAEHACVAAALSPTDSVLELLSSVAKMSEKPLPPPGGMVAVRSADQLSEALVSDHTKFIAVAPGEYECPLPMWRIEHDLTVVGLGTVTFLKSSLHVFSVIKARVHVRNVRVRDGQASQQGCAAFTVTGTNSWLTLSDCKVENSCEAGVVISESGRATISSCIFRDLAQQAVEVREQGSVEVRRSHCCRVKQGIVAYGGASDVHLEQVVLERTQLEGVLAHGDLLTAESKMQSKLRRQSPEFTDGISHLDPKAARLQTMRSKLLATELGWNGRLVLSMADCTIRHAQGLACSLDAGCAAHVVRCSFENATAPNMDRRPGTGILIKGGSDAAITQCRFVKNTLGINMGYNYAGRVTVQNCVFGQNMTDILDDVFNEVPPHIRMDIGVNNLAKTAGAWSTPIVEAGNQFLSKNAKIPEMAELLASCSCPPSKQPLPQKLAWEAVSRNRYNLATPCPCGFSSAELGNSWECSQLGFGNHVNFPPFTCLPASASLSEKLDDPNAQFYYRSCADTSTSADPFRHWCLMGEVVSVDVAQGADAHSFMASGEDVAKCVKMRTRFADQSSPEPDVEVLVMLDEPLAPGSAPIQRGNTLAVLYPEASDIDITRGTGQVVARHSSRIFVFAAPLLQLLQQAEQCARNEADDVLCAHCGALMQHGHSPLSREVGPSTKYVCPRCGAIPFCSPSCSSQATQHEQLCAQMGLLREILSSDFRSFDERFSFAAWAAKADEAKLARAKEVTEKTAEVLQVSPPRTADELCRMLDADELTELTDAIRTAEGALQETRDGSFVIKSSGRTKLQHKLKRVKARQAKVDAAEAKDPAKACRQRAHGEYAAYRDAGCRTALWDGCN